jgi:hypothetical protein
LDEVGLLAFVFEEDIKIFGIKSVVLSFALQAGDFCGDHVPHDAERERPVLEMVKI